LENNNDNNDSLFIVEILFSKTTNFQYGLQDRSYYNLQKNTNELILKKEPCYRLTLYRLNEYL